MRVVDPLAQSFYVEEPTGIFVTSIDLFFYSKDETLPVTVQLRPMELGLPTAKLYPFSEVVIDPKDIELSDDATVPHRVTFESPVYLKGDAFHSVVILSNSDKYNVWVSKLGEIDITSQSGPESKQIFVAKQPLLGGLFKSQNASTWNEAPYEDLKFTLYRANFTETSGNFNLYNPELGLGNGQIATLLPNSLEFSSKKIRVGLGTIVQDSGLELGNTVLQLASNATGNYVGSAGTSTGNLRIINAGIGFTPSSGSFVHSGVALTSITGTGRDATADVTITNGVAVAATVVTGGTGYVVGDVLTATQIGSQTLGRNLQLSVQGLSGTNELILDNVQGDFVTGAASTVQYTNSLGVTTSLNASIGANVTIPADGVQTITDGLHFKVNHKNHGMHAGENIVTISNVLGEVKPIKLTDGYSSTETGDIPVNNTVSYSTFENVGVSSTNPGYVLIGEEIIAYEGVTDTTLTGVTREIDQTTAISYSESTLVYKYEIDGVSLRRVNTNHTLQDSSVTDDIDLDYYHVKIDMSQDGKTDALPHGQVNRSVGTSFPKLYINESKSTGGSEINATQNIQFEIARPNIQVMSLNGTNVSAKTRTISGTSVDGEEFSFIDKGFNDINLNANNYYDSPRLIASKVNEDERLDTLPGNKSLNVNLELSSVNPVLSPMIDLDRAAMILVTNRINSPIENYATDNRVASLREDPSTFVYATSTVELEVPATSLRCMVAAYVNTSSDLRALYALQNDPSEEAIYYPFPGYSNLNSLGQVDNPSLSDGTPDKETPKTDVLGFESPELIFRDYEWNVDNLAPFRYFSIKLIGSSTNQAFPPRFRDFRVIALA